MEPQINSGEDILKKAKVKSDGQVFSTKTEGRGGKRCFRMQDLPSMLMVDKLWTKEIIPALLMWAGTLADPWTISDAEFMRLLRTIIQTIAPDFEDLDDICPGKAIFYIVLLVLFIFRVTHIFLDRHLNDSARGIATLDQPQSPLLPTSSSRIKKLACRLLNRLRGFALIS